MRRYVESDTPLGKLPLQTVYEDYRNVEGVKQPFIIHWSMPGRIWARKIDEIKQNVPSTMRNLTLPPSDLEEI